jgi:site-specific recombinase XerC
MVVFGEAEGSEIKAVDRYRSNSTKNNRAVTGIFVSRLNPRTSPRQMQRHLQQETGITLKPEQLKSKYNTYASFYVPCGQDVRRRLLDRALWPKGSLVKPFYS